MKKNLSKKLILSFCVLVMAISLLPSFSFAKSEKIQMIQKSKEEYILYISNLLNNKFEFAFANKADEAKENLNILIQQYIAIILTKSQKHIYG